MSYSHVPQDLRGADRYNLLGFDDKFSEYQERVWSVVERIQAENSQAGSGHADNVDPFTGAIAGSEIYTGSL